MKYLITTLSVMIGLASCAPTPPQNCSCTQNAENILQISELLQDLAINDSLQQETLKALIIQTDSLNFNQNQMKFAITDLKVEKQNLPPASQLVKKQISPYRSAWVNAKTGEILWQDSSTCVINGCKYTFPTGDFYQSHNKGK